MPSDLEKHLAVLEERLNTYIQISTENHRTMQASIEELNKTLQLGRGVYKTLYILGAIAVAVGGWLIHAGVHLKLG